MPAIATYLNKFNIQYFRNDCRLGPGGARNVGIAHATGKYIGFCDSDDWVDITCYESVVHFMEKYCADISMIGMIREYNDYFPENPIYKCKYHNLIELDSDLAFRILTYDYNMGIKIIPANSNKIYRSSFLRNNNLLYEKDVFYEDILFSVKAILNTDKIICVPDQLYHHYKRHDSIVQSFTSKHIQDYITIFCQISSFLKSRNIYDKYQINYFRLAEHFYNLIIRQIFEYTRNENERKKYLMCSFEALQSIISLQEYMSLVTSEEIRNHIQPYIKDTTIY